MVALPEHRQESLQETMARLFRAGFTLIPLGGPDGKRPLIAGWTGRRLPLEACLKRMANGGSQTYGIRLDGILVIDTDTNNEATDNYLAGRFEPSPVRVRTGRGFHHYYVNDGIVPSAVRADGISIDFKAGSHAFVVGPGSVRPDGRQYLAAAGDLASTQLPQFRDKRPATTVSKGKVAEGERNGVLWRRAVEYAPVVDNFDGLVADLAAVRDLEFDDPESVSDAEIRKVAEWAWKLRLEGRLWAGRNSAVQINRQALDVLLPRKDGADALALYNLLMAEHGHQSGKQFAIVPDAMIAAGLLGMSRRQIYRARDVLVEVGLLALLRTGRQQGSARRLPDTFRLQSPTVAAAIRERGVSSIIFSSSEAHGKAA